jgi:prevent-host-death family protein
MAISLTQDFKTVEELRDSPEAILRQVENTGRPVVITVAGKPAAVMLSPDQYEWMVHVLNLSRLLNQAEGSIRAGKVRPAHEFFEELLSKSGSSELDP